ncbi:MAG: hypothetical protein H6719_22765 [Sandaracinaceae bacterium]|nr:hypothetical protein [Sandaracinaceae bacterium]
MKSHPRNEGTTSGDLVFLWLMPVSIAALLALITYMAMESVALVAH